MMSFYLPGPPHPADKRVSAPVVGFSPLRVGFLQRLRISKSPIYASVKSAFSTSASIKLVPVKTVFLKIAPFNDDLREELHQNERIICISCIQACNFSMVSILHLPCEVGSIYNSIGEISPIKL